MKIAMIGPMPPPLGGATVLFQQLVEGVRSSAPDIDVQVISTARSRITPGKTLGSALRVLRHLPRAVRTSDVVTFHASRKGALLFAPVLVLLCRWYRKPWIFHGFGGYFAGWYESLPAALRWVARRSILSANALLVETRASVEFFTRLLGPRVHWYANSRTFVVRPLADRRGPARRFVYIGQVYAGKGLPDLLHASAWLDPGLTVDVYGPFREGMSAENFAGSRIRYCGVLAPEQVLDVLSAYDVMVLPSRLHTEGYPGAILEAFSVGVPVIASAVGAIGEIVDSRSGTLIEPGNPRSLADAINALAADPQRFGELRQGARAAVEQFAASRWTSRFVEIASQVAGATR